MQPGTLTKETIAEHYPDDIDWSVLGPTADELRAMETEPERFTYRTLAPQVTEAFWKNSEFDSAQFAKMGEKFCFIKTSLAVEEDEDPMIEDFQVYLDEELRAKGLGCQIGAGRGSDFYFFDLALVDVDAALEIMKRLAEENALLKKTWLMFYDTADKSNFVGLYPESPSPL